MSAFDIEEKPQTPAKGKDSSSYTPLMIHMPGAPEGEMVEVGPSQIQRVYDDPIGPRLLIIVDEVAELLMPTGVKNEAGKAEDALKQEISMIIQSITQLGRAAGINMILATQRNSAKVIDGTTQSNSLSPDTKLEIMRPVR